MYRPGPAAKVATALAAASLLFSSAASASVRASDHIVSASLVSASAQAAVCTTGVAAAGAAAAAQAAPAQPGCVLPVVDSAAAPVGEMPPPAVYVPPAESRAGIGVLPMLLGLVAVAGLIWLLLDDDDDDEISLPTTRG